MKLLLKGPRGHAGVLVTFPKCSMSLIHPLPVIHIEETMINLEVHFRSEK